MERVVSGSGLQSLMTTGLGLPTLPNDILQHVTLLSYSDDILVFLYDEAIGPGGWLLAWDIGGLETTTAAIGLRSRLRICRRLASKTKLFVRHNKDYLYYGTHSAQRRDGHHEWQIQGCCMTTWKSISAKPLRLNEFVGSEIGSTACFEIHGGNFYALSNQTSFDTEEVDWTSCYHFVCFKLDDASPDLKLHKRWRRQHHEGPINDAWTDLSLQLEECTGELNIVEVRKEWLGGGTLCGRTSYTTSFSQASDEELMLDRPNYPSNEQLSRTLDEHSKPSWLEKPPIRIEKFHHHEITSKGELQHEFIRAKTKHHSYSSCTHAFVDLVADEIRIPNSSRSKDRLRLRIASRIPESPLARSSDTNPNHLSIRPQRLDYNDCPIADSEETFTDTATALWPPPTAPPELFDLLCPGGRIGNMHAASDDKSIVYMAGTANAQHGHQRAIVMISFDPGWGHKDLKRLHYSSTMPNSQAQLNQDVQLDIRRSGSSWAFPPIVEGRSSPKRVFGEEAEAAAARKRSKVEGSTGAKRSGNVSGSNEPQRLIRTESAMYLRINQGFRVR